MLRLFNIGLVLALVGIAYAIYEVKYESRALDAKIAALGKEIETERDAVAVLRAEWSLLNRPDRIERLAEKYLKLKPAEPHQLVTLDAVADSDFEPVRDERTSQASKQEPTIPEQASVAAAGKPGSAAPAAAIPPVTVSPPGD